MPKKTHYRKDYQAPNFQIHHIRLRFELFPEYSLVHSALDVEMDEDAQSFFLDGDGLILEYIRLDGKPLSSSAYTQSAEGMRIHKLPKRASLEIGTRIYPEQNTALSGLYRSNQMYCTQCEAEGFRRITYFPDRPDVMTRFTTRIEADQASYPIMLSNGNCIGKGTLPEGRHWVEWEDPFKKPSYLFALVAGKLAEVKDTFKTMSGRDVALSIFVEPGNEDQCQHAMEALKRSMRWDETEYGREYDLDIFMIVAVSDFNMGAMENKGLNIFNAKYILARKDTATDNDFIDIESVVAHEYFHNWTGNRITCRDWFQLSLKEGLTVFRDQEYSRDMYSRGVLRIADVTSLLNTQYPEDAGAMAHPVRPESYEEINNFYTATIYNKGAEVIRMQQTLLTEAGFRRGMDLYFERHDGQAVTIDDFVAAMADANNKDMRQFTRWYSQAGTPRVRVRSTYDQGSLRLQMQQSCPATPECSHKEPFVIPLKVAFYNAQGERLIGYPECLVLDKAEQEFVLQGFDARPVISLLRDFSSPVLLDFPQSAEDAALLLKVEEDGYAKWKAQRDLSLPILQGFMADGQFDRRAIAFPAHLKESLISQNIDDALKAELLSIPSFEEVSLSQEAIEPQAIESARNAWRIYLGKAMYAECKAMYEALYLAETHAIDNTSFQRRALKNRLLDLLCRADAQDMLHLAERQYQSAKTMTCQWGALSVLTDCGEDAVSEDYLARFFKQWENYPLVLDKWFALQASSTRPRVLQRVHTLLKHPKFSWHNPNRARSVVMAFAGQNPTHFHATDGSGYRFLGEQILRMDALNPQLAARFTTPLTRLARFALPYREAMRAVLLDLRGEKLSSDVAELVSKSLES